mmetsp:Transcript_22230/g.52727  ORF Transcript_22230/g.52727 Transcript_22230/m.52727 type:complete len:221 (+) Transcript_22230:100-762(+)
MAARCSAPYLHFLVNLTHSLLASAGGVSLSPSHASHGCTAEKRSTTSSLSPGMSSSKAASSARERSRVRREAAARSGLPLAACTSSVAVDMATFIVISLMFGSGLSEIVLRSAASSGGRNTASKRSSVSRVTNQPRAPELLEMRARSTLTASSGIGSPSAHDSARSVASWVPSSCASSNDACLAAASASAPTSTGASFGAAAAAPVAAAASPPAAAAAAP